MSASVRDHIAGLRKALERDYNAKKELIDDLERRLLEPVESDHSKQGPTQSAAASAARKTAKNPGQSKPTTIAGAVHFVLSRATVPLNNAEITELVRPFDVKTSPTKTLARAVAGAVYNLKQAKQIDISENGKYSLRSAD